MTEIFHLR